MSLEPQSLLMDNFAIGDKYSHVMNAERCFNIEVLEVYCTSVKCW